MTDDKNAALSTINIAAAILGAVNLLNLIVDLVAMKKIELTHEQALNITAFFTCLFIIIRRTFFPVKPIRTRRKKSELP